jgi:hypothetical protein
MISAYFICEMFVSIEALPEIEQFNFAFVTETIFPNHVQCVSLLRPKMQAQGYWLHIDNAKSHNSALSLHKTEELRVTKLPQPLYFPDLVPCDFFLFDCLKKELQGMSFRSRNRVISAVTIIID